MLPVIFAKTDAIGVFKSKESSYFDSFVLYEKQGVSIWQSLV